MSLSSEEGEDKFLSEDGFEEDSHDDDSHDDDSDDGDMSSSDLSDDNDEDDETNESKTSNGAPFSSSSNNNSTTNHHQHHHHHHQIPPSHAQAQMLSFGPPYYGRPPTPLPPSPSLTSLLRPSRPTTPDASDDEHHGSGLHGSGSGGGGSGADPPVPRASPKVPTYEYYGFVLYLFSSLCFLIYLLWSYLPSPFLHVLGIYYYPNRWWSLAIPSFLVMLLVYIYVALALYNTEYLTLPLHSLEAIVDEAGKIAVLDGKGRIVTSEQRRRNIERERERVEDQQYQQQQQSDKRGGHHHHQRKSSGNGHGYGLFLQRERMDRLDWRACWNEGTDAVMDVPLAGVCEVLYGNARGVEGEDDEVDEDDALGKT